MAAIQNLVLTFCPKIRCVPQRKLKLLMPVLKHYAILKFYKNISCDPSFSLTFLRWHPSKAIFYAFPPLPKSHQPPYLIKSKRSLMPEKKKMIRTAIEL